MKAHTVRWLSRRAVTFHVLLAIIVPFCLFAGWWQVNRALSGNLLSYAYSVEWPAFAVIAVIGWWQLVHEDPSEVMARREERARRRAAQTVPFGAASIPEGGVAKVDVPVEPVADGAEPVDSAAAYNAYLRSLASGGQRKTWRNPRGLPS